MTSHIVHSFCSETFILLPCIPTQHPSFLFARRGNGKERGIWWSKHFLPLKSHETVPTSERLVSVYPVLITALENLFSHTELRPVSSELMSDTVAAGDGKGVEKVWTDKNTFLNCDWRPSLPRSSQPR